MTHFIQTRPSPNEGPHAQEVSPEDFAAYRLQHPKAPIIREGDMAFLILEESAQ